MKLLDSTAINYILKNDMELHENYFVTPDIRQEMLVAEIMLNKKAPDTIKDIISAPWFDECLYLKNYSYALNKYGGRSFFNMTGFGDVSLIAVLKTLVEILDAPKTQRLPLPDLIEKINAYIDDPRLIKKIKKEVGDQVLIYSSNQI